MSHKTCWWIAVAFFLLVSRDSRAQDPTSRLIPFSLSTSLPLSTTQEVTVELWGAASDGGPAFSEANTGPDALAVDDGGNINFLFGSLQAPPGLLPEYFPSGSSRYLDVTQNGASVLGAEESAGSSAGRGGVIANLAGSAGMRLAAGASTGRARPRVR